MHQSSEQRETTLRLINTEVAARLDRQIAAGNQIDTKSALVLGFTATAAQFLANVPAQGALQALAFGFYLAAFAFGVAAVAVARYTEVPEPRALLDGYAEREEVEVLSHLAATRVAAFESNVQRQDSKACRWTVSVACLASGIITSAGAMLVA